MPSAMVVCSTAMFLQKTASVHLVSGSFLLMKAMEYSVRGVGTEMVCRNICNYVMVDLEF